MFKKLILVCSLALMFSGCAKEEFGDVTFWQRSGTGFGITVVELNGNQSNITSDYASTPDCGDSGCAVFNALEYGTYSYTASDGSSVWSGTLTVDGSCLTMELY